MENLQDNHDLNPYNSNNIKITIKDLVKIFSQNGLKHVYINNLEIFQNAFVHKSYIKKGLTSYLEKNNIKLSDFKKEDNTLELFPESNERLEFLGDSIIDAIVVSYLYRRYFDADEGFMTKLKSRLVKTNTLGLLAKKIGLDKFLIISDYVDSKCNGRENIRILEDLFESFIGAMFLDLSNGKKKGHLKYAPGYSYCETFLIHLIEKTIDFEELVINDDNYKDILLKYFQKYYSKKPKYKQLESNNNQFTMCVYDHIGNILGKGTANTKKEAEQMAAKETISYMKEKLNFILK